MFYKLFGFYGYITTQETQGNQCLHTVNDTHQSINNTDNNVSLQYSYISSGHHWIVGSACEI